VSAGGWASFVRQASAAAVAQQPEGAQPAGIARKAALRVHASKPAARPPDVLAPSRLRHVGKLAPGVSGPRHLWVGGKGARPGLSRLASPLPASPLAQSSFSPAKRPVAHNAPQSQATDAKALRRKTHMQAQPQPQRVHAPAPCCQGWPAAGRTCPRRRGPRPRPARRGARRTRAP
jgi:hypothetical protein